MSNPLFKAKRPNKSEKLFGYPKCDILKIDFRNPTHLVFLTYKHYSKAIICFCKVLFEILNSFRICLSNIRKALRICYDATANQF